MAGGSHTPSDRCYWCATEVFPVGAVGIGHPKLRTVDHVRSKPECVSGKEYRSPDNQVIACYACNQRRSLEWCRRRDAGLVHPTAWSIRLKTKERRRQRKRLERRAAEEQSREPRKPCWVEPVVAPEELSMAFDPLRSPNTERWRSGNF